MSFKPRQKLLSALSHDDIDWYRSILQDTRCSIDQYKDANGLNIFHDISNSLLSQNKLINFFNAAAVAIRSFDSLNFSHFFNELAKFDEELYTPLHLAIVKRKKVTKHIGNIHPYGKTRGRYQYFNGNRLKLFIIISQIQLRKSFCNFL